MTLREWLEEKHGRARLLAEFLRVSAAVVSDWKTGSDPVPIRRCGPIVNFTNGLVTRQELRPNDWREIWPELAGETATAQVEGESRA